MTSQRSAREIANDLRKNADDVNFAAGGGVPTESEWARFTTRNRALWEEAKAAGVMDEVGEIVTTRLGLARWRAKGGAA